MTDPLYNFGDKVIFHFPKNEMLWPINYDKTIPKEHDNTVNTIIGRNYMLDSHYYVLSGIGHMWIKESFLEPIVTEEELSQQMTNEEFDALLEV